jgi:hypothetical protein
MSNGIISNNVDEQLSELLETARLECMNLLDSARFSTWRDCHLNGSLAGISILVRPDRAQPDTCRIDVICQSAGQLRIDWERVPLELVDSETDRVLARGVLDSGGRSRFTVPSDTQERRLRFRNPVVTLEVPALAFAMCGGPPPDLERSKQSGQLSIVYAIEGEVPGQRTLKITVRSLEPSLRGGKVRVEIRSKRSPKIGHSKDIDLVYEEGEVGEWEIREEILGITDAGDLKIEAQPLAD